MTERDERTKPQLRAANDNSDGSAQQLWSQRFGRELGREERRQIAENMLGVFKLLAKWSRESAANDNCADDCIKSDSDEVQNEL